MANKEKLIRALVFPKAGHFMLQKYRPDGTLDPDAIYTSPDNIVKSIKRATTPQTSDLSDGNSAYPAHTFVTSEETLLTLGLSSYDPAVEAFVKDADIQENSAEQEKMRVNENLTAAASAALGQPVKDAAFFLHIKDKFGAVYTPVAADAEPTAGQYKVAVAEDPASSGVQKATLTFAADDAGRELFVVYDSYQSGVTRLDYKERSSLPAFQVTIIGEASAYEESQQALTNIVIDKATLSGGITPPDQSNDPTQGWEIVFKTGKPRPGHKPVSVKFLPLAKG